jgi:hypothetical protein
MARHSLFTTYGVVIAIMDIHYRIANQCTSRHQGDELGP